MKKLSVILLLGLFSCGDNLIGENYYTVFSVTKLENEIKKYSITLKCNINRVGFYHQTFYTDSLY